MKRILFAILATSVVYVQSCKVNKSSTEDRALRVRDSLAAMAYIDSSLAAYFADQDAKNAGGKGEAPTERPVYRASNTRLNDIVHTKLEVKFNYETSTMPGKATLTVKPYFYATDSLILDAKAMDINEVAIITGKEKKKLDFKYDKVKLRIKLDRVYTRNDQYTVFIDYVSNPEKVEEVGSEAITSAKGLYFIDPKGTDPNKPTQIWTQGETEASSCWFPTVDSPNEKTTEEIYMTVEKKYLTLSNGKLISQKDNGDGTRTDYWRQDLPHAPYLFMMAVGEFAVIKDKWRGKEVNYYVEKEYENVGRKIFGNTPEMLTFFSEKLGVEYPWDKYSQIVVRDYVSGAMENTTATVHGEFLQRTERELLDETNESIIAHELFHHWFGDLVTAESWSNLPLNESFANYSEYLWFEYKYGRDEADDHNMDEMNNYFGESEGGKNVDLIRFDYTNKEDMFDRHSYDKGGRVLHMLRKYVGDDAFFASLKDYLTTNKFQPAEIHNLRLSFEKTTGEDLNWFFNQWFLASGHPELDVEYGYKEGKATITVKQVQDLTERPIYKLPVDVDVYVDGKATRTRIVIDQVEQTFSFNVAKKPELIVFDAEHQLLAKISDNKTTDELVYQYSHAPLYYDRWESITRLAKKAKNPAAAGVLKAALDDKSHALRQITLVNISKLSSSEYAGLKDKITGIAKNDPKAAVRAKAINALVKMFPDDNTMASFYKERMGDQSYTVVGAALNALNAVDKTAAIAEAKKLENEKAGDLLLSIATIYSESESPEYYNFFINNYKNISGANEKYSFVTLFTTYITKQTDDAVVNKGIDFAVNILDTENAWWMKLAGYTMLNAIAGKYDKEMKELKSSGNNSARLTEAKDQFNKVVDLLRQRMKEEKDPKVLKYLGGDE